jgi:transposase
MLAAGRRCADRVWAVEGCNGVGRHIAHRLVHDGETVLDVPAKLSAQVRVFATGNGRKTDPVDAHSVALVALRTSNLVRVRADPELVVMGMLVDRRDELAARERRPSTGSISFCWSCFPAGKKGSSPRHKLARLSQRSSRGTWWARPNATQLKLILVGVVLMRVW